MFRQTVVKLGYSAVACIQISEISPDMQEQAEDVVATMSPTLKYVTIPLASCTFSDSDFQLSEDALQHLQEIEDLLGGEENSNPQQLCEDFFEKFGSHAFKGPLTFGGIYWYKWQTQGNECFSSNASIEETRIPSSAYGQQMCEVSTTGGPDSILEFPEWKSGLIASNTTWMIIDRGTYLVPVWEIIDLSHKEQFKLRNELSCTLRLAWEKMVSDSELPIQHLIMSSTDSIYSDKRYHFPEKEYSIIDRFVRYTEESVQFMKTSKAHIDGKYRVKLVSFVPTHVRIKATVGLAKEVQLAYYRPKQIYESILISTLMYPFYHNGVLNLIYLHDLECLTECLRKHCLELSKIINDRKKYLSNLGAQIYLFKLAVDIYISQFPLKVSEKQALKQVEFMKKKLGDQLHPAIEHVLSTCSFDWNTVKLQLQDLGRKLLLFESLHLDKHYIDKLGIKDALLIREETLWGRKCTELKQLPLFIMQMIMAYDCRCRTNLQYIHSRNYKEIDSDSNGDDDTDSDDDNDDEYKDSDGCKQSSVVNPMDGLLALICCADDFLRQDLIARLSSCQLAVPLLLPDPFTHKVTFSLWSLKSVVKEWWCEKGGEQELSIINCKAPIVSFLRLGKHDKSKSHIMNEVISDSDDFNHFFHRDCEGGYSKQLLGKGLVEVVWYLPSGKEIDVFPSVVTFLNLHGDAQEHPKQVSFLSEVSFMSFVLMSEESLNDINSDLLKKLSVMPGGTVLLLCSKEGEKTKKLIGSKLQSIRVINKNPHEVKNGIRRKLNKMLKNCVAKDVKTLVECETTAKKCGFDTDKDKMELTQGTKMAEEMLELIVNSSTEANLKEHLLPLQGKTMWQEWTKLDKEEYQQVHRGDESTTRYSSKIFVEKLKIRQLQLRQLSDLSGVMISFLAAVTNKDHELSGLVRRYFMQWLKLGLSELSRNEMPQLRSTYSRIKRELGELQQPVATDSSPDQERKIEQCKQEIANLHEKMVSASFGIEHILREVGQIYEAAEKSPYKEDLGQFAHLPGLAADVLIDGDHIELMDGDAAHVPITWINAILQELKVKLGDCRMFVLSVLGLQSSGKSTLMNTTFGVQFNVSAGRCTRGAFLQLLPVEVSKFKCDYVLVIDTEGLRAPSLGLSTSHDNKLATFVIGLANLTMINIYGEISGDMDDILQTVVHAFLRMKNVELALSCQFVHQNVASIMASSKGGIDRYKFKEKLDRMTCAAAKAEDCEGQYKYFSDLIKYDEEMDVHYFPTLWRGDPPMAPVNYGYSQKAQFLKFRIINLMESIGNSQPITAFQIRLQDLWNAILHENFVFSFRNTLEIIAYSSLDDEFTKWAWFFQKKMIEYEQTVQNVMYSTDNEKLRDVYQQCIREIKTLVETIATDIHSKMEGFFEDSKYHDILPQWKNKTEQRLDNLATEMEKHAITRCEQFYRVREKCTEVLRQKDLYHKALLERVKRLISESEEKLDETQLMSIFDEHWIQWKEEIHTIPLPCMHADDIEESVEESLTTYHHTRKSILSLKLKEKTLCEWGIGLSMAVKKDAHVGLNRNWIFNHLHVLAVWKDSYRKEAQSITDSALRRAEEYLEKIQHQPFNEMYTSQLLYEVLDPIHSDTLIFKPEYTVELSLIVCGYAVRRFQEMEVSFWKQNSPMEFFEQEMYEHLSSLFKNQCLQIAQEKASAEIFCKLLKKSIESQVIDSLCSEIVGDIIQNVRYFSNKSSLKAKILIDLAENFQRSGKFDEYYLYLNDIQLSLKQWIKHYTKLHCEDGEQSRRIIAFANANLSQLINFILDKVKEVTLKVPDEGAQYIAQDSSTKTLKVHDEGAQDIAEDASTTKGMFLKTWLELFCKDDDVKKRLKLDISAIQDIGEIGDSIPVDISNFSDAVDADLRKLSDQILTRFQNMTVDSMDNWKLRPYDILYDRLHGCCEQCPFCKEQCEHTFDGHSPPHIVGIHRPQCLGGYRWIASSQVMIDTCNALVASAHTFKKKRDSNEELEGYAQYYSKYPKWYIQPSRKADISQYWKWLLANHQEPLARAFNARPSTLIPVHWTTLKWEDVKQELIDTYQL